MQNPFNPVAHDAIIAAGFDYQYIPASWEDIGNGETGPMLDGGPAFDCYSREIFYDCDLDVATVEYIYISEDGRTDCEITQEYAGEVAI